MRKSRFTEPQIAGILQRARIGTPIIQLCCEHGVSITTFYHWRRRFRDPIATDLTGHRPAELEALTPAQPLTTPHPHGPSDSVDVAAAGT